MSRTLAAALCPFCVNGEVFSPHLGQFVPCADCSGRGKVVVEKMCVCSLPIRYESKNGHFYCGNEECLKALQKSGELETAEKDEFAGWNHFNMY